jgi:thiol-disulfide isomerase/thioredoxin
MNCCHLAAACLGLVALALLPACSRERAGRSVASAPSVTSASAAPAPDTLAATLTTLAAAAEAKRSAGARTPADYVDEIRQMDALLATHAAAPAEAAQVAAFRAEFTRKMLRDPDGAIALLRRLQADHPGTPAAAEAGDRIVWIERLEAKKKLEAALAVGAKFPAFTAIDTTGRPLTRAGQGGRAVLVEFWAMWCSDCRAELPNLVAIYEKFHPRGLDIVGVSLDKEEDRAKFAPFLKANGIAWPQHFDGKFWDNALALLAGVNRTPTNYLLAPDGTILAKNLTGPALAEAITAALK